MEYNKDKFNVNRLSIKLIDRKTAADMCRHFHYMGTYPSGFTINYGIFLDGKISGVCVFGESIYTVEKTNKILKPTGIQLEREDCIEQMRLWVSDRCGSNSESYAMSLMFKHLKENTKFKIVLTHSGGCKNDCGIIFQSSGWLYFGKEPCSDFFLTKDGKYRNIVAELAFGRIKLKGRKIEEAAREAFGDGKIINAFRYRYLYPIDRGIRRKLTPYAMEYEKTSNVFRLNQQWCEK